MSLLDRHSLAGILLNRYILLEEHSVIMFTSFGMVKESFSVIVGKTRSVLHHSSRKAYVHQSNHERTKKKSNLLL